MGGCKDSQARHFCPLKRQQTNTEHTKFCLNLRKKLYCKDVQILEQTAHRGCGVSAHGDTQHVHYHGSGQPAIADTAFMQWHWTTLSPQVPSNLSDYTSLCPKIILWVFEVTDFCNEFDSNVAFRNNYNTCTRQPCHRVVCFSI